MTAHLQSYVDFELKAHLQSDVEFGLTAHLQSGVDFGVTAHLQSDVDFGVTVHLSLGLVHRVESLLQVPPSLLSHPLLVCQLGPPRLLPCRFILRRLRFHEVGR